MNRYPLFCAHVACQGIISSPMVIEERRLFSAGNVLILKTILREVDATLRMAMY